MLIYAQIEDAVIAAISAASTSNALGYKILSLGSYGGEFDDETFFTQFRKFPAVWVTVAGSKPQRISAKKWKLFPTVVVMVGTRNVRGERQTRHGAVGEVGSYQLLDDVRNLLIGRELGLPISPLAVGADRTLYNTRMGNEGRSVLSAEFPTSFIYTAPDLDANAGNYTTLDLNYYLKPGDDVIDATDVIPLAA